MLCTSGQLEGYGVAGGRLLRSSVWSPGSCEPRCRDEVRRQPRCARFDGSRLRKSWGSRAQARSGGDRELVYKVLYQALVSTMIDGLAFGTARRPEFAKRSIKRWVRSKDRPTPAFRKADRGCGQRGRALPAAGQCGERVGGCRQDPRPLGGRLTPSLDCTHHHVRIGPCQRRARCEHHKQGRG